MGLISSEKWKSRFRWFSEKSFVKQHPIRAWWRVLRMLPYLMLHFILQRPLRIQFRKFGSVITLRPGLGAGSAMICLLREHYENELCFLDQILASGECFVDGGANVGVYSAVASAITGIDGRVIAIEPCAETFAYLEKNVRENQLSNVVCVRKALSDSPGSVKLYHRENAPASFSILSSDEAKQQEWEFEEVQATTLDHLVSNLGLRKIHLLKLDIEGAEGLALRGAMELLSSENRPKVVFEVLSAESATSDPGSAWSILQTLGYRFFAMNGFGELESIDAPAEGNIIALHPIHSASE